MKSDSSDIRFIRRAIQLARRGLGHVSPNPMVGAVLVRRGRIIGQGWHHRAGEPHAEIEALRDAARKGNHPAGATLYVSLEPCSTHGRTPPCTAAIIEAGIRRVVVGAIDPNPGHRGQAFGILKRAGISVTVGVLGEECERLNEAFNHWIVQRAPLVTVKAAMTLDGKIATFTGQSKWITNTRARERGMELRRAADAILVGINTVLADNPSLTVRPASQKPWRRIVLDTLARTPLDSKVVTDEEAMSTTIVVGGRAPKKRVAALRRKVEVKVAPTSKDGAGPAIQLGWLLKELGREKVTHLLVEGGGEVNASFLLQGLAHRVAFFYAPSVIGGRDARKAVAGVGIRDVKQGLRLTEVEWTKLGADLLLTGRVMNGE